MQIEKLFLRGLRLGQRGCEALQDARIRAAQAPKETAVTLTDEETRTALELLKSPNLLDHILEDFDRAGLVGEATNKLVAYLACVSRKLDRPLAVMVQSTSAAGKSSLMDATLAFIPEEERVQYSAMTGQSLFYLGEQDLKHKVLAISEEAGAEDAAYALKLLLSEGELTIASTGKDPVTGELKTRPYHVEGPVAIFSTTTAIDLDEELQNRCLVLSVDETREQTRAIHEQQRQRRTLEGLLAKKDREHLVTLHRNAQRLLKPLAVINPYARYLTFLDDKTRTRRDHEKYLTLIESIALLHQYQRAVKTASHQGQPVAYIEVTLEDIETANQIAHEVLGRTLDELPPQTRRLLHLLHEMVAERCKSLEINRNDYRFSRREIREYTGWSYDQVRMHLARLVAMEYLLVHQGRRGRNFVYELLYDGQEREDEPHLSGLIDVAELRRQGGESASTTKSLGGRKPEFGGSLGGHMTPIGGPLGDGESAKNPSTTGDCGDEAGNPPKRTSKGKNNGKSYRSHSPAVAAKGVAS